MPPVPATHEKVAWIYVRVSDESQEAGHSPETQEAKCRELAASLSYTVGRVAWEQGSARNMRQRVVWKSYNRAMRLHQMDAIIVYAYSRLHRNFISQIEMLAAAKRAGVAVLSVSERTGDEKYGKYMTYLAAMFAEMESDNIGARTLEGNRTRAAVKGMPLVGKTPPYGYRWVERQDASAMTGATRRRKVALAEDEVTGPRMRAIWAYLDNPDASLGDCCTWLTDVQRWPAPQGGAWRKSTLRRLLANPVYWGEAEAFRTVMTEVRETDEQGYSEVVKRPRPRAPEEVVKLPPSAAPALVSKEQAMRVRGYIAARSERHEGRSPRFLNRDAFLLTGGLIRCGHVYPDDTVCGGSMSPRRRNGRHNFYVCHTGAGYPHGDARKHYVSIRAEDAERFAVERTLRLLIEPGEAEAAVRRAAGRRDEADSELADARAELAACEGRIATLRALAEHLTPDEMGEFAGNLRQARAERERWQKRVDALADASRAGEAVLASLRGAADTARRILAGMPERLAALERGEFPWTLEDVKAAVAAQGDIAAAMGGTRDERRRTLFALGAHVRVLDGEQRDAEHRLAYDMDVDAPAAPDAPGDAHDWNAALVATGADGFRVGQGRNSSGFRPVAVSASHARSTPTMSCSA